MDIKNPYLKLIAERLGAYGVRPRVLRDFAYPSSRNETRGIPCETLWYYMYEVPYFAIEAMTVADALSSITIRILNESILDKLGNMRTQFLVSEISDFRA